MPSLTAKGRISLCLFSYEDGRRCRTPRIGTHPHFCFFTSNAYKIRRVGCEGHAAISPANVEGSLTSHRRKTSTPSYQPYFPARPRSFI